MIPTVVVIPSRYEPARLLALLRTVQDEVDRVIVLDNGHRRRPKPTASNVVIEDAWGMGIYAMWNRGWRWALDYSRPVNVAILNDDIRILPGTIRLLAAALRREPTIGAVYPDRHVRLRTALPHRIRYTIDNDPAGPRDLTGYCFVFKGELPLPPFDEGYHWWYGDTQFDESVKLAGYGVAQVNGVPIEHRSDAEANNWARRPELRDLIEDDAGRWAELHAEIRDGKWWPISERVA